MNAALAQRNPYLIRRLVERGDEIIGHGWHMDSPHFGGMDAQAEEDLIKRSLSVLRDATGQEINGWLSPGRSQSKNTPDMLAQQGISYMGDWINDDMPYAFRTESGDITAMPLSLELEDRFILMDNLHSEVEYADQIKDAFDYLYAESEHQGGRLLALAIHPWILGQPHRIGRLEDVLAHIMGHDGVWSASAGQIGP